MMKTVTFVLAIATISTAFPQGKVDKQNDGELAGVMEYLEGYGDELYKPPNTKVGDLVEAWKPSERASNPEELGTYVEGDIVFPKTHKMRNGMRASSFRWPDGQVPYVIKGSFSDDDKAVIDAAIAEYHEKTCIRLIPRTNEEDYVVIKSGNTGCWSSVGRIGGAQDLNLQAPGCIGKGTVMHEMMHALGFLHEQSRWERDDYVIINYANIQPGLQGNFQKAKQSETDNFGVPYDYRSVMHYGSHAFSANGEPTIISRQPGVILGQRDDASPADVQKIRRMYKCD